MSRGFVKEEDQEEAPFIPPRAALPPGVINYVTPQGYALLLEERENLEKERKDLSIDSDKDRRQAVTVIDGKLNLLNDRISSARILRPEDQRRDEVRFGAKVRFRNLSGKEINTVGVFTIVGVDEANIEHQKIAFLAPLARALTGKKVGEVIEFKLGAEIRQLEIEEIDYDHSPSTENF